jgi:hypothetical protein
VLPDNLLALLEAGAAVIEEVAEEVDDTVAVVVTREIEAKILGKTTPTHLLSALEL